MGQRVCEKDCCRGSFIAALVPYNIHIFEQKTPACTRVVFYHCPCLDGAMACAATVEEFDTEKWCAVDRYKDNGKEMMNWVGKVNICPSDHSDPTKRMPLMPELAELVKKQDPNATFAFLFLDISVKKGDLQFIEKIRICFH